MSLLAFTCSFLIRASTKAGAACSIQPLHIGVMAQFLELPTEIRLQIYAYLKGIHAIPVTDREQKPYVTRFGDFTSVLLTNRKIYHEALPLIAKSNGMHYQLTFSARTGTQIVHQLSPLLSKS